MMMRTGYGRCDGCPNSFLFPEKYGFQNAMVIGTETFSQNAVAIRVKKAYSLRMGF